MKYSLFLIADDNSARWERSIIYSFVAELQVDADNFDRWGSIRYVSLLFPCSIYTIRNVKILYLDIYEFLMVNHVAITEKI